jgi:hypothetical protein
MLSVFILAWYPYEIKRTLSEKNIKGPVKTIFENVDNWDKRNIVVQNFNLNGKITEIRFYAPKTEKCIDSFMLELLDIPFVEIPINADYKGLDTNEFEFSHRNIYKYGTNDKISHEISFIGEDKMYSEKKYEYDRNDSLILETYYRYDSFGEVCDSSIDVSIFESEKRDNQTRTVYPVGEDELLEVKYYDQNKCIKCERKYSNDTSVLKVVEYSYGIYGKLLESNSYQVENDDTIPSRVYKYTYDKVSKLIKKYERVDYFFGELSEIRTIAYFYSNEVLSESIFNKTKIYSDSNLVKSETRTQYDKYGNSKLVEWHNVDGSGSCTYKYEYDNFGNWTNVKAYENNVVVDSAERIILYHDL